MLEMVTQIVKKYLSMEIKHFAVMPQRFDMTQHDLTYIWYTQFTMMFYMIIFKMIRFHTLTMHTIFFIQFQQNDESLEPG